MSTGLIESRREEITVCQCDNAVRWAYEPPSGAQISFRSAFGWHEHLSKACRNAAASYCNWRVELIEALATLALGSPEGVWSTVATFTKRVPSVAASPSGLTLLPAFSL